MEHKETTNETTWKRQEDKKPTGMEDNNKQYSLT